MALKDRFRRATSSRKTSTTSSSPSTTSSSPTSSAPSSGLTTPNLSRTPSVVALPALVPTYSKAPTAPLGLTKTTSTSSSGSSRFSLSRFRSNSSSRDDYARYAPKNFRFPVAHPEKVAVLQAWELKFGRCGSISSMCSGVSPIETVP